MKMVFFPSISFLYSCIEKWLFQKSKRGYSLVSKKGWIWFFAKGESVEREYFVWLKRWKGKDCSKIAGDVSLFYKKEYTSIKKINENSLIQIIEVDLSKINEVFVHYRKKRNYICMKISMENFLIVFLLAMVFTLCKFPYLWIVYSVDTIFLIHFLLNFIQWKKFR